MAWEIDVDVSRSSGERYWYWYTYGLCVAIHSVVIKGKYYRAVWRDACLYLHTSSGVVGRR